MTPGTMMRTRAKVLTKVRVTWVREAKVTLQQLTATTNAAAAKSAEWGKAAAEKEEEEESGGTYSHPAG